MRIPQGGYSFGLWAIRIEKPCPKERYLFSFFKKAFSMYLSILGLAPTPQREFLLYSELILQDAKSFK
jgi:hypothetical protein